MKRRPYGSYCLFTRDEEPEKDDEKKEYVKTAVCELLDQFVDNGIVPDWNTMKLIIKEGYDFMLTEQNLDAEEEEESIGSTFCWQMTVAIKFESESYPEEGKQ